MIHGSGETVVVTSCMLEIFVMYIFNIRGIIEAIERITVETPEVLRLFSNSRTL